MKRRAIVTTVIVAAAVILLIVGAVSLMAQPGAGGGRGGARGTMGSMQYLERSWAALAFELNATPEQLTKLRPVYQKIYDERKAALDKARAEQDFQAMGPALEKAQADIDAALKTALTPEQLAKWQQLQQAAQGMRRRPQGGGGGGGG
jgi:Spy/CpxP family protein refolding chaperone